MLRKIGLKLIFLGALSGALFLTAEQTEAENLTCQDIYNSCITDCRRARDVERCENQCWTDFLNCYY